MVRLVKYFKASRRTRVWVPSGHEKEDDGAALISTPSVGKAEGPIFGAFWPPGLTNQ